VKYWEIIAAKFRARGLSWGCSSETDANGRVLYTADAFSKDGKRFTVLAADKLSAFLELERQVLTQAEDASPRHWEIIAENLSKASDVNGDLGCVRDLHASYLQAAIVKRSALGRQTFAATI
jgi:hypothetical protein